jgi:hypothetical protein
MFRVYLYVLCGHGNALFMEWLPWTYLYITICPGFKHMSRVYCGLVVNMSLAWW